MSVKYDSTISTLEHIERVAYYLQKAISELYFRKFNHDDSKLREPEKSIFDIYTPKLEKTTYGSKEYNQNLAEMKKALEHHYSNNRHHPEHFSNQFCLSCKKDIGNKYTNHCPFCDSDQIKREIDFAKMNLIDILEMLCDWIAASERHSDGDIFKSIEINQERFGYDNQIKKILENTVRDLFNV
ncbi:MAG: DUF5662 family protein [bacterium]